MSINNFTDGQVMSWYHKLIVRIPHGKRIYNKKYLNNNDILNLFNGIVEIQEKIDGKLSITKYDNNIWMIEEDISGKHTVHDHVLQYKTYKSRIQLDIVTDINDKLVFESTDTNELFYTKMRLVEPDINMIYKVLEILSRSKSHYGTNIIEGLVVKNYENQLMGKWINEEFENELYK